MKLMNFSMPMWLYLQNSSSYKPSDAFHIASLWPCKFSQSHRIGSGDLKTSFQDIHRVGHRSLRMIESEIRWKKWTQTLWIKIMGKIQQQLCAESCIINGGFTQLKEKPWSHGLQKVLIDTLFPNNQCWVEHDTVGQISKWLPWY